MGTWSTDPFGNDDAADWAGEFEEAPTVERSSLIESAFRAVIEADMVEIDSATVAIAAAAVVASRRPGGPQLDEDYGPEPDSLDDLDLPSTLGVLAVQALRRVESPESEWYQLWDEAGSLADAVETLSRIRSALS